MTKTSPRKTCLCGQAKRYRQPTCAACHRRQQLRDDDRFKNTLQVLDALLLAGRCMHGGMTSTPCTRKATSRQGHWATCDTHWKPPEDEQARARERERWHRRKHRP